MLSWISVFFPSEDFPPIGFSNFILIMNLMSKFCLLLSLRLQQFKDIPVIKMSLGYKKHHIVQESKRRHFSNFLKKIELPLSIICVQRSFGYCGCTLLFQSHCSVVDES